MREKMAWSILMGLQILFLTQVLMAENNTPAQTTAQPQNHSSPPPGVDASWQPFIYKDAHVKECRVGIELGYTVFEKYYHKDVAAATAAAQAFIEKINYPWVSEVMIHWTLADLVIRQTPEEDKHPDGSNNGIMFNDTHHLFIVDKKLDFALKVSTSMNGGLGGGYCATIPPPWWAFDHEASHGFGLPHEHGYPYERGPQNISCPSGKRA